MKNDEIMGYYDDLMQLAIIKGNSRVDAEDLVGDTMLAAFTYIHSGKEIEHPKTWLANTLSHKHNDRLRKKYRSPITVCLDDGFDIADEEDHDDYLSSEEAANVRKELNHLTFITREVLIRFYYGNQSVETIAKGLNIPEGTVKSRLYSGRNKMKKGFETMENKDNYLPGKLYLSFGGAKGVGGEPMSLVEGDLIAQNLLILAYEKPVGISELSRAIGIPAAYIEPIVKKLVDGELMVQTDGGKLYTDFIITKPQDAIHHFKPQLEFAHKHFDKVWGMVARLSDDIRAMDFVQKMNKKERTKLDRYAVLKALQDFEHHVVGNGKYPDFPKRKDGGRWLAHAIAMDAGYNETEYNEAMQYAIQGGHRTTRAASVGGTKEISLYEFDTTLWDSPHRYGGEYVIYDLYFKHIIPLLWHIYAEIPLEHSAIPNEFISYMKTLEDVGMIRYSKEKAYVDIPVIKQVDYDKICLLIKKATAEIKAAIGKEFAVFAASMRTPLPKHLTSVPELYRYRNATEFFVMAIVREAYEKGLHLNGVDYCCPPVVLVYNYGGQYGNKKTDI